MITYLYVKTHNVTGLKYLGKTTKQDPYKYPGSGTRWTCHLKKHGYEYSTEILKECISKEEVRELGLYYSELWNVVESDEWANLKPENGDGGELKQTPESIAKQLSTKLAKGTNKRSPESNAKMLATRNANDSYKRSPESNAKIVAKMLITKNANNTLHIGGPWSDERKLIPSPLRGRATPGVSISNRNRAKTWTVIDPQNNSFTIKSLSEFCIKIN